MSKLIKNTSLYTIGNIIPQIANFFLLPLYTSYLSPSDYGIVQSMQVLSAILIVFFTMAIDRSVYRLYFDFKTEDDKKTYLSTIAISLFIISVLVLGILFSFNNLVSKIYSSISFYPFYFYAITSSFLSIYAILPKIYYQINEKANKFITLSILQFVSNTGFVLWNVVFLKMGAEGWLKGLMLGNLITLPIFIFIITKVINFKFNYKYLVDSLKFSLPVIPSLLSAWILNLSDRIFIEQYFSMKEVGIYSLGYKIAGLILILASAFNLAYNPIFYRLANSENQIEAKKKLSKYNYIYILVIVLSVFGITFFAKEILYLFFSKQYFEAYKIVFLISIAYLIGQISGLFNLSLYQVKKTKLMMYIVLLSAIVNIILNYLLIPIYGIYGAAYATILSFLIFAIIKYFYAKQNYYIKINWKSIFIITIALFLIQIGFNLLPLCEKYMLMVKAALLITIIFIVYFKYLKKIKTFISQL